MRGRPSAKTPREAPDTVPDYVLESWRTTVHVQMHFNDLQLKLRNFAMSVFVAVVAGWGAALKYGGVLEYGGVTVHSSACVAAGGIFAIVGFYLMDLGYHQLLRGAVNHGMNLEQVYKDKHAAWELGLSLEIKESSPLPIFWWMKLQSEGRLRWLYRFLIAGLGLLIAVGYFASPPPV